jgi:hypothetical protein
MMCLDPSHACNTHSQGHPTILQAFALHNQQGNSGRTCIGNAQLQQVSITEAAHQVELHFFPLEGICVLLQPQAL